MSFVLSIAGQSDDWTIANRGAFVLVDLLRQSGMDEKIVQTFEVATSFNGIEINMLANDDVELSRSVLTALNPVVLGEVDVDLRERYHELHRLLTRVLAAFPENTTG